MNAAPGVQAERTALAWDRTIFAMAVACTVLLRASLLHGSRLGFGVAVVAASSAIAFLTTSVRRRSQLKGEGTKAANPALLLAASAAVLACALAAVLLVIVPKG